MATVKLDITVHRKGIPANVTVKILNSNMGVYSKTVLTNGTAVIPVPANEEYHIYLDPYNKKVKTMLAQQYMHSYSVDLDDCGLH